MMAFSTKQPTILLSAFKAAIDRGDIQSWRYDSQGNFTLTSSQWTRQAWFSASIGENQLCFHIYRPDSKTISRAVFVCYQTYLIETFMRYLFMKFDQASATSNAAPLELAA
jgi:hypothetical protein